MKKQTVTKIILGLIIFALFVSISPFFSTTTSAATSSNMSALYSNPNQDNGKNPYKFKVTDVVNSNLLTNVVGCTGVVNKVSAWMMKFVQSPVKQTKAIIDRIKKIKDGLKSACSSAKAGATTGAGTVPQVNDLTSTVKTIFSKLNIKVNGENFKACQDQVSSTDDSVIAALDEQVRADAEKTAKEQCFDGIAITLAKNQLTAMTRSAVNWVNSGYGGNPFFVQSMTNLTNGIERNVLETGIDVLLTPDNQNPYARDFARSAVIGYGSGRGLGSSSSNFLSGLQSDLGAFITDPKSYYTNEQLGDAQATRTALQRAQDTNNAFANDFSTGGWNGWLALTQRDQNNPLGFTMLASQNLADTQARQITQTNNELSQNNGFLNQKVCVKWQVYNEDGKPKKQINLNYDPQNDSINTNAYENVFTTTKPAKCYKAGGECCASEADGGWKVITPGSLIKDKTTNYLNSPERQLELAKTINDSLNALFSILISKLESGGLSGLSDNAISNANWTDSLNSIDNGYGPSTYDNNGAYNNFNLTRDLGNTYIHDEVYKAGDWNASTNKIIGGINDGGKMSLGYLPPVYKNNSGKNEDLITSNLYWEVTAPGNVELVENGYNNWEVGDRAFWDGSGWQNWKCQAPHINVEKECSTGRTACISASHDENYCQKQYYLCIQEKNKKNDNKCTNQLNPIKTRGVIQIQKDYIVAAKEILKVLPSVMPKLGELDYCLPGPNPSYKTNSTDAQSAWSDWVGSIYVGPLDAKRTGYTIDNIGSRTYDNLANIYTGQPNVWKKIREGMDWLLSFFDGYHYKPNKKETEDISNHQEIMDENISYVTNNQFQNFYEVFDKMMDKLYFKSMTNKYLESENTTELKDNPAYIPMAEAGLNLTKDILYYNDEVTKSINSYKDSITQAQLNISKLEPIKAEVSKIILAAQARRDKALLEKLKKETELKCAAESDACMKGVGIPPEMINDIGEICLNKKISCLKNTMTEAQYKEKYAGCLSEENIQFFDIEDITGKVATDPERCNNGIDDDLDGLVDMADPDCKTNNNGSGGSAGNYSCLTMSTHETDSYLSDTDCSNGKCLGILKPDKFTLLPCGNRQQNNCETTEFVNTIKPTSHFNWFDPYNAYQTTSCAWLNVIPTGKCSPVSESTTDAYYSDLSCSDGKCLGNLNRNGFTPVKCENRSPNDCTIKESIYAGPSYHQNWFDPYNEYTVKRCEWKPY